MSQILEFSLGPVQSFVAQARRTRDFWSGSYLLSWLTSVAMRSLESGQGKILFPCPPSDLLQRLASGSYGSALAIPNRFRAEVPSRDLAERAVSDLRSAWLALADLVWSQDIAGSCLDSERSQQVWKRQIESFWEISWVLHDEASDHAALLRRKSWRSSPCSIEGGHKCTLFGNLQELSGSSTPREARGLWEMFGKECSSMGHDLSSSEQLCAPAFIKRRFARHFAKLQVELPSGEELRGTHLTASVPSVGYLAIAPWIEAVISSDDNADAARNLCELVERLDLEQSERETRLKGLESVANSDDARRLLCYDLGELHEARLSARLAEGLNDAEEVAAAHREISSLSTRCGLRAPSPFYAILAMDGDRLGALLRESGASERLPAALDDFTRRVPGLVIRHSGFLIYAGGDDVLAILPPNRPLACARELRQLYREIMSQHGMNKATLSGAVQYCHIKAPLARALSETHALLDDVAKDKTGRDAIAVRVVKGSGESLVWSRRWHDALNAEGTALVIEDLAGGQSLRSNEEPTFSSKFLYQLRRYEELWPEANADSEATHELVTSLLTSAYKQSRADHNGKTANTHRAPSEVVQPLLQQSVSGGDSHMSIDAALLVRFLSSGASIER